MYEIVYFRNASGRKPVEGFIDSLNPKMRAKVFGRLELLEEYGPMLGMPLARHLSDGIFELRTICSGDITRILYFFVDGKRVVLTHGFVKKAQKTPAQEIDRAKRIRNEWRMQDE